MTSANSSRYVAVHDEEVRGHDLMDMSGEEGSPVCAGGRWRRDITSEVERVGPMNPPPFHF
jgi:hypothetical protein